MKIIFKKWANEGNRMVSATVLKNGDVELRFLGNLSQKNDSFDSASSEVDRVRALFGNSQYAYAKDPWVMNVNPSAEFWLDSEWALSLDYKQSMIGQNAPKFWEARGGLVYRWAYTEIKNKKRIREVDISTDQEAGLFPGEEKLRQGNDAGQEAADPVDEESSNKEKVPEEEVPADGDN